MPIKPQPKKVNNEKTDEQKLQDQKEQEEYLNFLEGVKEEMYGKKSSQEQTNTVPEQIQTDETSNVGEKQKKTELDELLETVKKKSKMEMTRVFVDKDLAEIYKLLAMREGVTMSSLMSAVLSEYLKDKVDEVKHRISTKKNKYL